MTDPRRRLRLLRVCVILALLFNLMALVALVRPTPIIFTLFMFLGQPLFAIALILLVGALLAELRAKQLF